MKLKKTVQGMIGKNFHFWPPYSDNPNNVYPTCVLPVS